VRPCRPGAQQQQQKHHNQNGSEHEMSSSKSYEKEHNDGLPVPRFRRPATKALRNAFGPGLISFSVVRPKETSMKRIVAALAGVAWLASPASAAARHSTDAKEREITKQLNLEQAQQAQSAGQPAVQMQATAPSAPAAAPTTPVESAPADGG